MPLNLLSPTWKKENRKELHDTSIYNGDLSDVDKSKYPSPSLSAQDYNSAKLAHLTNKRPNKFSNHHKNENNSRALYKFYKKIVLDVSIQLHQEIHHLYINPDDKPEEIAKWFCYSQKVNNRSGLIEALTHHIFINQKIAIKLVSNRTSLDLCDGRSVLGSFNIPNKVSSDQFKQSVSALNSPEIISSKGLMSKSFKGVNLNENYVHFQNKKHQKSEKGNSLTKNDSVQQGLFQMAEKIENISKKSNFPDNVLYKILRD